MSLQVFVFAIFVLAQMCSGHMGGQLSRQDENPRVYCGRALSNMIAAICYNVPPSGVNKRADSDALYGGIIPPFYKEQDNHIGWPWMPSSKAHALGSDRGKRFIGGIADECCDKPCSINELLNYC